MIPEHGVMEDYEVEHEFPHLGTRIMRLNACQVFYKEGAETTILLGIEDVTVRRKLEQEKDDLLQQKDVLLEEIQHRIANSLQIIAGIILMKANTVSSEETRPLLQDIHDRVISIAAVQRQLHASGTIGPIEMVAYLRRLSEALATSMIGDARPVTVRVVGDGGTLSSRQAESIGLITTELVMNSLKHAFTKADTTGQIIITYEINGTDGELSVADNGAGSKMASLRNRKPALAPASSRRLRKVSTPTSKLVSGVGGTTVSVTHTTYSRGVPAADPIKKSLWIVQRWFEGRPLINLPGVNDLHKTTRDAACNLAYNPGRRPQRRAG